MKIRHKQSGVELEGVRDSGPDFVEGASVIQPSSIYSKEHWEAVPEWVEASVDVEVSADGEAMMGDGRVISRCPVGYRFRKVRLSTGIPPFSGERWAFIVERKV
jgi:hypothetical protein